MRNFRFERIKEFEATERNLAIIVDVCTQSFRLERVLDQALRAVPWYDMNELPKRLEQLREAVQAIDIVRNRMPSYDVRGTPIILLDEENRRQREKLLGDIIVSS